MIPIRTEPKPKGRAVFTWALLLANIGIFWHQIHLGDKILPFIQEYALIPQTFFPPADPQKFGYFYPFRTLLTSAFLHGGWLHLLGNLIILWVFGRLAEDRLGSFRFLLFYLLAGMVSALGHILFYPQSAVPCVGASGAIAGLLGAGLILFPRAKVITLVPFFVIIRMVEIPAFLFLLFWFMGQVWLAHRVHLPGASPEDLQIAVMVHIVGFAFGFLSVWFFRRSGRQ